MSCKLYQSVKLSELVDNLQPLFEVISSAFGPTLAKVILAKSTGEVTVTNDGMSILNAASAANPVVK